jgi:hypothetical protein
MQTTAAAATTAVTHQYGLGFMYYPRHILTDKYYPSFAKVLDLYNWYTQAYKPEPSTYSKYVHPTISEPKNADLGIPRSVETSTTSGTATQSLSGCQCG